MTASIWSPEDVPGSNTYSAFFNRQGFDAVEGQTDFNLLFSYTVGMNSSAVYSGGVKFEVGKDYTELSTTSIRLVRPATAGDRITVYGGVLVNPSMPPNAVSAAALAANTGAELVGTANGQNLAERLAQTTYTVDAITAVNATALGLVDGDVVVARGRSAAGDPAGIGVFRYSAASAATADGGVVVAPTAGPGRLIRDGYTVFGFNGPVKAAWWGQVANGTTDDYAALQAAVTYCTATGGVIQSLPGTSMFSQRVIGASGVKFEGIKGETVWKPMVSNTSSVKLLSYANATNGGWKWITFDGNASNPSASGSTNAVTQLFNCQNFDIVENEYQDTLGIALNLSTTLSGLNVSFNKFTRIAFANGVGGTGYRQSIAMSGTGNTDCDFVGNQFSQCSLDCISVSSLAGGTIAYNECKESYTLIYTNVLGCSDLDISFNRAIGSVNVGGSAVPQPAGIDLPVLSNSRIIGNHASGWGSCGIGVFSGSGQLTVSGNICINNNQSGSSDYPCGIAIKSTVATTNIILSSNVCTDTQGSKTQDYGLIYEPDLLSVLNIDNSNNFTGNGLADIAEFDYPPSSSGTLIRSYNQSYSPNQHVGYFPGHWYAPSGVVFSGSPVAQATNTIYLHPFTVFSPVEITDLGVRIHAAVVSTQAKLAIYANSTAGRPGVLLREGSAAVSGESVASVSTALTANLKLMPGTYWMALLADGAISVKTAAVSFTGNSQLGSSSLTNVSNAALPVGLSAAATYSSGMPATLAAASFTSLVTAICPIVNWKAAA